MLGWDIAGTLWAFMQCHLQELREMQSTAAGQTGNLLPATESIGDNQRGRVSISNGRQQRARPPRPRRRNVRPRNRTSPPCRNSRS